MCEESAKSFCVLRSEKIDPEETSNSRTFGPHNTPKLRSMP